MKIYDNYKLQIFSFFPAVEEWEYRIFSLAIKNVRFSRYDFEYFSDEELIGNEKWAADRFTYSE